MADKKTNKKYI